MKTYPYCLTALTTLAVLVAGLAPAPCAGAEPSAARATDWANWRGPHWDGSSDARDLPETFSKTENVLWTAELPGPSNGTPVLSGDRVFTTAVGAGEKLVVLCLDRTNGKVVWQKEVGRSQLKKKGENNVATPSPTTDGKTVVFLFGTGDLAAFDFDGKELWARNLQKEVGEWNINWIYGSSPTLHKGKLYIQVLQNDKPEWADTRLEGALKYDGPAPSFLLALDPATGKQLWKQDRPSDAIRETRESYGTPVPHTTAAGREEILLVGGEAVTGHDPETGKELWRFTGLDEKHGPFLRLIPSVVAGGGYLFACAPKGGPVTAIREGGSGDISKTHKAWVGDVKQLSSDVCVPLFYRGQLYVLGTDSKKLSRVDPATGEVKWATNLGGPDVFRASPTGADGKIYCLNRSGDLWVVSPDDGKVLHKTSFDAPKGTYGSVAVTDGMLVFRVGNTLYAFGKK